MIYIDHEFICHTTNPDGAFKEVETTFFDGKCVEFIEGYRFIPAGKTWTRSDGTRFSGEMISPCKDYSELDNAQREYEKRLLTEYKESLQTLGVEV